MSRRRFGSKGHKSGSTVPVSALRRDHLKRTKVTNFLPAGIPYSKHSTSHRKNKILPKRQRSPIKRQRSSIKRQRSSIKRQRSPIKKYKNLAKKHENKIESFVNN